jgi:UDP-glucose 4-epimerase
MSRSGQIDNQQHKRKSLRILMVGGAGFVGSYTVRSLKDAGHDITILDPGYSYPGTQGSPMRAFNLERRGRELIGDTRRYYNCATDESAVKKVMSEIQPEVIVHLGNWPLTSIPDCYVREAHDQTVIGCHRLMAHLPCEGLRRFVYVSSSMVYGDLGNTPIPENAFCRPDTFYGKLKLECEGTVVDSCRRADVDAVIVRPTGVYGSGDVNLRVVQRFLEGACFGTPLQVVNSLTTFLDFTHVTDTARGLALAAVRESAAGQVFNISSGRSQSLSDLVNLVRQSFEEVDLQEIQEGGSLHCRSLDISKARELLDFQPRIDLETGVTEYAEDIRSFANQLQNEQTLVH